MRIEASAQVSVVSGMEMQDIDELLMDLLVEARQLSHLLKYYGAIFTGCDNSYSNYLWSLLVLSIFYNFSVEHFTSKYWNYTKHFLTWLDKMF